MIERPDIRQGTILYVILGLPASGKSTLAYSMLDDGLVDYVCDDPSEIRLVHFALNNYKRVALTDPHLCNPKHLDILKRVATFHGIERVAPIYFKNDPEQCKVNAKGRSDKPVEKFIEQLSRVYNVPSGVIPLEVYRGKKETVEYQYNR